MGVVPPYEPWEVADDEAGPGSSPVGRRQRDLDVRQLRPDVSTLPLPNISGYLLPGEEVRYIAHRHPIVLAKPLAITVGVFLLLGAMVTASGAGISLDLFVWVTVGTLAWLGYRILSWVRTALVVTSRRVFDYRSLVVSRAAIRPVFRQGIRFVQSPIGRQLNYGTVITRSPTGEAIHTFRWIRYPRAFYQALTQLAH